MTQQHTQQVTTPVRRKIMSKSYPLVIDSALTKLQLNTKEIINKQCVK